MGNVADCEGGEGGKNKSGDVGTDGSENSGDGGGGVHWMGNKGSWSILSRIASDGGQSSRRRRDRDRDGRYLARGLSPFLMNVCSLIVAVRETEKRGGKERKERSEREAFTEKSDVRERAAIFIFLLL